MSQINTEFGRGNNLNAYRGTSHSTGTFPSGAISFSDFYGRSIPASGGTFSPNGGASSGSRVSQYAFSYLGTASVTITCTQSATWTYSRLSGSFGSANISSGASASSITFSMVAGNSSFRYSDWNLDATSGSNTRYWVIQLETEGGGGSCPLCCFTPDTLIRMADGSEKPIVDVQVGEFILVYDEALTSNVAVPVSNVITRVDRPMYELTFEDGNTLRASEDHPLYVVGRGYSSINPTVAYKDFGIPSRIEIGDRVLTLLGAQPRVVSIEPIDYPGVVYTFGNTRFYANGVLVY